MTVCSFGRFRAPLLEKFESAVQTQSATHQLAQQVCHRHWPATGLAVIRRQCKFATKRNRGKHALLGAELVCWHAQCGCTLFLLCSFPPSCAPPMWLKANGTIWLNANGTCTMPVTLASRSNSSCAAQDGKAHLGMVRPLSAAMQEKTERTLLLRYQCLNGGDGGAAGAADGVAPVDMPAPAGARIATAGATGTAAGMGSGGQAPATCHRSALSFRCIVSHSTRGQRQGQ